MFSPFEVQALSNDSLPSLELIKISLIPHVLLVNSIAAVTQLFTAFKVPWL